MKHRSLISIAVLCFCFLIFGMNSVFASTPEPNNHPSIYINGEKQDLGGILAPSGTTLVPFRAFFSILQLDAQFDNQTKTVTATNKDITVALTSGKNIATINGKEVNLLQSPWLSEDDGMLYVNLRFIAEAFGGVVKFDKSTLTINIDFPMQK